MGFKLGNSLASVQGESGFNTLACFKRLERELNATSGTLSTIYNNSVLNSTFVTNIGNAVAADPTAEVILTAVNGTASTLMRSDAAPPLNQAISPTMTGVWTFHTAGAVTPVTIIGSNTTLQTVPDLTIVKDGYYSINFFDVHSSTSADHCANFVFRRTRGTTASPLVVADVDQLGVVGWRARDTAGNFIQTGVLGCLVNGTPGAASVPTDMLFQVGATQQNFGTAEKMRLTSTGRLGIGCTGTTIDTALHVLSSSAQLKVGTDNSNFYVTTVSSIGNVNFNCTGTDFSFSDQTTHNLGLRIGSSSGGFYNKLTTASAQGVDITYTLPQTVAASTLLTSTAGGVLSWATPATLGLVSGTGVALHAPVWLTTTTQGSSDLIVAYGGTFTAELSHLNLAANRVIYLPEVGTDAILLAYHTVQPTDGLIPRFTSGGAAVEDSLWDASGGTLTSIGSTGIYYQNGSSSVTFKMGSDGLNFWLVTQALSTAAVTYDAHGGGPHQFLQNILLSGKNLQTDTGTGMKIGTATNQRVGFFNATPIVQPANTVPIDTLLASTTGLGLRASGGVARFATTLQPDTNGGISLGANGFGFSSLWLKDTVAAFELQIQTTSTGIAADRVLTIDMGNANRTLDLPNVVYPTSNFTMTGLFGFTHLQDVTFDASKNINLGSGSVINGGPNVVATAATAATAGVVTITAGNSPSAAGGNLTLTAGDATAGAGNGGDVIAQLGNSAGGTLGSFKIKNAGGTTGIIDVSSASTTRIYSFPNASINIAGINIAQTFSATQTFADIKIGTAGNGLYVKEGANATMGIVTLVAGVAVVSTTKVTANSRIFLTRQTVAGTVGTSVDVTARTAATSFTITAAGSVLDTSTVAWWIAEPA